MQETLAKSGQSTRRTIVESLLKHGYATSAQIDVATRKVRAYAEGGRHMELCDVLVRDRFITRGQAQIVLGEASQSSVSANNQSLLPVSICQRYSVFPVQAHDGVLTVRAATRLLPKQLETIRSACSLPVESVRITPVGRQQLMQQLGSVMNQDTSFSAIVEHIKHEEINSLMLRRAIDALFAEALDKRASDIHLDCKPDPDSWVSLRVDNMLQQSHIVPERLMSAIFTRLKTESGMDASDTIRAQDGRFSIEYRGKSIDFRVASQPIVGGETLTLRVLDPESLPALEVLFEGQGQMIDMFRGLSRVTGKNGGLILFSGPTGSGKTTTLYTLTQQFERDKINVITVEDPVEYQLAFARQIQLNQILNQKAIDVESSILRHDPDVIVFGEIRNADSARAAMKFTESGHLVLATIHAVSATQTFERFMSFFDGEGKREAMFIMAHYLRLIINQRLVRRLCKCGQAISPNTKVRRKVGCRICGGSGYYGRVVAHETVILPTEESVRGEIARTLLDGGHVQDALALPGAVHKRRIQVMSELLANGLIDMPTVQSSVEV